MATPPCLSALLALAAMSLPAVPRSAQAQVRATLISEAQNAQPPYVYTGRLTVRHGPSDFFGSAANIRRYTALTCGHLLYDEESGFSTNVKFDPHFYLRTNANANTAAAFAVLSGYQAAADRDGDSDAAFARDLGYVLLVNPAPLDDWANWQADPDALLRSGPRLVLGYAAETFPGSVMAAVTSSAPYEQLQEGLYESSDYYTQSGMSGGPVFLFTDGVWQIFAETVAGTASPGLALSDVRAITAEARVLLIDAEYNAGLVRNGFITGAATVAEGSTNGKYNCGVVFADGRQEGTDLSVRYTELKLKAAGPNKGRVSVRRAKAGKFKVDFSALTAGESVELRLQRDTAPGKSQTPLARYVVTVD